MKKINYNIYDYSAISIYTDLNEVASEFAKNKYN